MLNHIDIMGRIVADPELRVTSSQTSVTTFTVAVDRDRKDETGAYPTDFIDCVAWRTTAEYICKYFRKGSSIAISGRLQIHNWEDKEGRSRRSAEIMVEDVHFGESKRADAAPTYMSTTNIPAEQLPNFTDISDNGEFPF